MARLSIDGDFYRTLEGFSLVSQRRVSGNTEGSRITHGRGYSLEFFDYRNYEPGDDFRYIDWNIMRRTDKPYVKLFHAERDLALHVFLDVSSSMFFGEPQKMAAACRLAAGLAYVSLKDSNPLRIVTFSDRLRSVLPYTRSKQSFPSICDFLENIEQSQGITDINASMREYAGYPRREGLCIIISDFLAGGGFETGVVALSSPIMEVVLVRILSADEAEPPFRGKALLVDSETEEELRISFGPEDLEAYRIGLDTMTEAMVSFCSAEGVRFVQIDAGEPLAEVMEKVLSRRRMP